MLTARQTSCALKQHPVAKTKVRERPHERAHATPQTHARGSRPNGGTTCTARRARASPAQRMQLQTSAAAAEAAATIRPTWQEDVQPRLQRVVREQVVEPLEGRDVAAVPHRQHLHCVGALDDVAVHEVLQGSCLRAAPGQHGAGAGSRGRCVRAPQGHSPVVVLMAWGAGGMAMPRQHPARWQALPGPRAALSGARAMVSSASLRAVPTPTANPDPPPRTTMRGARPPRRRGPIGA